MIHKKNVMKHMTALLSFLTVMLTLQGQQYGATWESLDKRPVPQWYQDAKFGIFIHWGVYSVPGYAPKGSYAEWYQNRLRSADSATAAYHKKKFGDLTYYQLADFFKAELFDPQQWASLIENSGARYVVITSKHHDGFALWPSKEASASWGFPWNASETGPHRDLLGDLFTALRKTTVHAGLYYSLYEWYNPLWLKDHKRYVAEHAWPQMKDVINTYRPDVFWTDGDWEESAETWKSKEFLQWMYNESPVKDKVVTYDRWGNGIRFKHGGVFTPEYQPDVNFEDHYWEESRGMGYSYGYNREEDSRDYNSSQALVLQLIDKVSGGGNLLLDIGPDEHGKIPPIMQERLLQMGEWMNFNQEAIYNTVHWRTKAQWGEGRRDYHPSGGGSGELLLKLTVDPDPGYAAIQCFYTYNPKENALFAILPQWPANQKFIIKDLAIPSGTKIELLQTHEPLKWEQQGKNVQVEFPAFDPARIKSQPAYVIKISSLGDFAPNPRVSVEYPSRSPNPLISVEVKPGCSYHYTMDGTIPDTSSATYRQPFLANRSGNFSIRSFKRGALPGVTVSVPVKVLSYLPPVHPSGPLQKGLKVAAYTLTAKSVEDLETAKPGKEMVVNDLSLDHLPREEYAGLMYKGYIDVAQKGIYNFLLSSDDGSRLWIDNQLVIDNDGLHANTEKEGRIALQKGYHAFRLAYFQDKSSKDLKLKYRFDSQTQDMFPVSMYRTEK